MHKRRIIDEIPNISVALWVMLSYQPSFALSTGRRGGARRGCLLPFALLRLLQALFTHARRVLDPLLARVEIGLARGRDAKCAARAAHRALGHRYAIRTARAQQDPLGGDPVGTFRTFLPPASS